MVWTNTSLQGVGRTKTPLGERSSVQKVGEKTPDKAWPPKLNFQKSPEITFLDIISQPPGQVSSFLIKRVGCKALTKHSPKWFASWVTLENTI
jgi:hypothetical protein